MYVKSFYDILTKLTLLLFKTVSGLSLYAEWLKSYIILTSKCL